MKTDINLLPEVFLPASKIFLYRALCILALILILIVIGGGIAFVQSYGDHLSGQVTVLQELYMEKEHHLERLEKMQGEIDSMKVEVEIWEDMQKYCISFSEYLTEIKSISREFLYISYIYSTYEGYIRMEGQAFHLENIAACILALEHLEYLEEVKLSGVVFSPVSYSSPSDYAAGNLSSPNYYEYSIDAVLCELTVKDDQ